jgi:hypothetical protein
MQTVTGLCEPGCGAEDLGSIFFCFYERLECIMHDHDRGVASAIYISYIL